MPSETTQHQHNTPNDANHAAQPTEDQTPEQFWEARYAKSKDRKRGKPGKLLQEQVAGLPPGRALELGCSTGDDSLWLAEQGWQVTAVDLSEHAIETARRLAAEAGLAERIHFQAVDLATTVPQGPFELVTALYFQSPFDFPRAEILRRAAEQLVPGGRLLLVSHATAPPWAGQHMPEHMPKDLSKHMPTLEQEREALQLTGPDWQIETCSLQSRIATGPEGQQAELQDNLIVVRRKH